MPIQENRISWDFPRDAVFALFTMGIQSLKEILIGTSVNFFEFNQHTDADVQLPCLVLGVAATGNIAPAELQLGAELFLGDTVPIPESAEVVSDTAITAEFLFHAQFPSLFDQYWLQFSLLYAIISKKIVRDTGHLLGNEVKNMICCVTGHRPDGFPFDRIETDPNYMEYMETLSQIIEELIQSGYNHFITGMAEGADLDFAHLVLQHRKNHPHIRLEAALPYPIRAAKHIRITSQERSSILEQCDSVQEVSPAYHRGCMQKRNMFMVDKADLVLAIWNGTEKGGTWNTIRYARQKNKSIRYIYL